MNEPYLTNGLQHRKTFSDSLFIIMEQNERKRISKHDERKQIEKNNKHGILCATIILNNKELMLCSQFHREIPNFENLILLSSKFIFL